MSEKHQDTNVQGEHLSKRVATFGRKELAVIASRYTLELLGVEQPVLDPEQADRFELGRWAFGHIPRRRDVSRIEKIEVYERMDNSGERHARIFMEPPPKPPSQG